MDERETFLDRIRASPEDDTVRLVFADWLSEHGDEPRAELIRAQIELHGYGPEPDSTCCALSQSPRHRCAYQRWHKKHPKARVLKRRADDLLIEHWLEWIYPAAGCLKLTQPWHEVFTFRRGFVDEARMDLSTFYGSTCLVCNGMWSDDDGCPRCRNMVTIEKRAASLFAHPVTKVTLTDRVVAGPWHQMLTGIFGIQYAGMCWFLSTHALAADRGHHIPLDLGAHLRDHVAGPSYIKLYRTREEAAQALSDACVVYGRAAFTKSRAR